MSVELLYHGHSNLEIHHAGHRVQIDPFYDQNPLSHTKAQSVNPQVILLTHAHFDHTADAEAIARRTGAVIAANYEMACYYEARGVKTQAMNHGGGWNFPFGRATLVQAFHTSTFPDGSYGGQPGGWIVEIGGKVIYHAGDTALFGDMALLGEIWPIDVALLPIGDCFTMGPAMAIRAARMLNAKQVIPIHYNTFPPIQQDAAAFAAELQKQTGITGRALTPGQKVVL